MASYTIEDVELLRRKSGISYQEAVSLLDYHNGNVARALVDLERNGRMKPEPEQTESRQESSSRKHTSSNNTRKDSGHRGQSRLVSLVNKLYRARVRIFRNSTPVLNLSLLFALVAAMFSPHLLILSVVMVLVLGYRVSFVKNDPDFAGENMERMVKNAASNVRSTVNEFARSFQDGMNGNDQEQNADNNADSTFSDAQRSEKADADGSASFYRSNATPEYHACPTINVPVQVESQDGHVTVEDDADGFHSATIK